MVNRKGFSFAEVSSIRASTSKVVCCHLSSDGKLLASGGHEKKAMLWNMDTLNLRDSLEGHVHLITDVRFSPNSTVLAPSSFDSTDRVWDANNPIYSLGTFTGHSTSVMSLDFHISFALAIQMVKSATGMLTSAFAKDYSRLLAAGSENVVSIFDFESKTCVHSSKRHTKPVHSLCWDQNGRLLASVSEDSVRVWAFGSGSDAQCTHELNYIGNKFHSCAFHPIYGSLLVIRCCQSLEPWNMAENKIMTIPAHDGLIATLTASPAAGMVASAKLWK